MDQNALLEKISRQSANGNDIEIVRTMIRWDCVIHEEWCGESRQ
jgi:hypothetical protein